MTKKKKKKKRGTWEASGRQEAEIHPRIQARLTGVRPKAPGAAICRAMRRLPRACAGYSSVQCLNKLNTDRKFHPADNTKRGSD